jgi:hypothetical protein
MAEPTFKQFEKLFADADKAVKSKDAEAVASIITKSGLDPDGFKNAFRAYKKAGGTVYDYGFGDALLEGLSLGFRSEIAAGIESTFSDKPYEQAYAEQRAGEALYREKEPTAAMIGEVAGSLPTMLLPAGALVKGGQTVAKGIGLAGAEGAISGFGQTEGGVGERATGAMISAPIAAATAGLADPLMRGAGRLFGRKPTASERVTGGLSEALPEDLGGLRQQVQRRVDTGDTMPETLADIGGADVQSIVRGVRSQVPETREKIDPFLTGRVETQEPRIGAAVEKAIGTDKTGSIAEMAEGFKTKSTQAYRELRSEFPEISMKEFETDFRRPTVKAMYGDVLKDMLDRVPADESADVVRRLGATPDLDTVLERLKSGEDVQVPFDFLERFARRLGSEARVAKASGDSDKAQKLTEMSASLKSKLDTVTGQKYSQARKDFAISAEMEEAMELGQRFGSLKMRSEAFDKMFNEMSEPEKFAFSSGVVDDIITRIEGKADNANLVKDVFGSTRKRKMLATILGGQESPAFKSFAETMAREARMVATKNMATGGSNTVDKLADARNAMETLDIAADFLMGADLGSMALNATTKGIRDFFTRGRKKQAQEAAVGAVDQLLDPSAARQARTLSEVEDLRRRMAIESQQLRQRASQRASLLGGQAGLLSAQGEEKPVTIYTRDDPRVQGLLRGQ